MRFVRRNAIAIVALVFAMAGTSLAASRYIITSTSQIKPSVLRKLHGTRGPQGPAGALGPTGPTGPTGPAGPVVTTALVEVTGPEGVVEAIEGEYSAESLAVCPAGDVVVSGGDYIDASLSPTTTASKPVKSGTRSAWWGFEHRSAEFLGKVIAYAECAASGKAITATSGDLGGLEARVRRERTALIANARASRRRLDSRRRRR